MDKNDQKTKGEVPRPMRLCFDAESEVLVTVQGRKDGSAVVLIARYVVDP